LLANPVCVSFEHHEAWESCRACPTDKAISSAMRNVATAFTISRHGSMVGPSARCIWCRRIRRAVSSASTELKRLTRRWVKLSRSGDRILGQHERGVPPSLPASRMVGEFARPVQPAADGHSPVSVLQKVRLQGSHNIMAGSRGHVGRVQFPSIPFNKRLRQIE
jgi:hypothetical protein